MFNKQVSFFIFIINCLLIISCAPQKEIISEKSTGNSQNKSKKTIIANIDENYSKNSKTLENNLKNDKVRKEVISNLFSKKSSSNNVIFEFKNERYLQGIDKKEFQKKSIIAEKAINATFKMLTKTPSTGMESLKFNENYKVYKSINYKFNNYFENEKIFNHYDNKKNILVLLPMSGLYKKFGKKIRQALELSLLETKGKIIQISYFDTGKNFSSDKIIEAVGKNNPTLILGPLLRENIIKIKSIYNKLKVPIISFNNDNSLAEQYLWITGFSPQEQVKTMVNYSTSCNKSKLGFIGQKNKYGEMVFNTVNKLVRSQTLKKHLLLDERILNDKNILHKVLKRYLNYKENNKDVEKIQHVFDTIFLIGDTNFILEVMPILTYYDLDTSKTDVLGTNVLEDKILRTEHSVINAKFPKINDNNVDVFRTKWKKLWKNEPDTLSRLGYDIAKIGMWLIFQEMKLEELIKTNNNKFTVLGNKYKFLSNGEVMRPIEIMKIDKLGKPKKIKLCQ